jgi:16S rRNA (cytidine1402-2'-O)-methyltransferase
LPLTPSARESSGRLYLVSTPIGNLADITLRAIETLRSCDVILCEDTRHSRTLLTHHGIETPVQSLHEHNEARETPRLVARMLRGDRLALISDAGTPLVSDPGARLVQGAIAAGIDVVPIPGPSALLAAVVASGLGDGTFTFHGFLARKRKQRDAQLAWLSALGHPSVLYEAGNRVVDTLEDLAAQGAGERQVAVARELTKQFEEIKRGTVAELIEYYRDTPPRGEVVIVVDGASAPVAGLDAMREAARVMKEGGAGAREVTQRLVNEYGASRNVAYRLAHED